MKEIGDEGVLAMICDSTNVFSAGRSGSEADVRKNMLNIMSRLKKRIIITSFASNVARMETAVSILATLEAKDVMIILFFNLLIIFSIFFLTSASDPDLPALKTFVESQIIARTPSSPISFNLLELILSPIKGLGSTFQSPVCKTTPAGVFILSLR